MDSLSSRRWQLSFVAWRWGRLLWIALLAALLAGIGYHLHQFRQQKVIAKLLVDPVTTPRIAPLPARGSAPMPPAGLANVRNVVSSPEVLAIAAEECGLTGLWRCSREEAASRLDSLLTCNVLMTPPTIEIEVPKFEGADALKVCGAVVRQAMFATTEIEQAKLRHEIKILEMSAEFTASTVTDLEKQRFSGSSNLSGWLTTPGSPLAKDPEGGESKRLRGELDGLKQQIELKQMELRFRGGPLKIAAPPHWDQAPLPERMKALGITLAWAFGGGMILALLLAYLAETLRPRLGVTATPPGP